MQECDHKGQRRRKKDFEKLEDDPSKVYHMNKNILRPERRHRRQEAKGSASGIVGSDNEILKEPIREEKRQKQWTML